MIQPEALVQCYFAAPAPIAGFAPHVLIVSPATSPPAAETPAAPASTDGPPLTRAAITSAVIAHPGR